MTTCRVCGRWLTDAISRAREHGPECDPRPELRRKIRIRLARRTAQRGPDLLDQLDNQEDDDGPQQH